MTKEKATKDKDAGRKHFTAKDYRLICDWLDEPGNLDNLLGTEGKTKINGKQSTKKQAFESMAEFINERQFKGSTLVKMDFQSANFKNRFNHISTKYKRTKQLSEVTGFGLTAADEADGVHTIKEKLERLCHCFERLDNIFGDKPKTNIAANLYLSELTSEGDGTPQSDFLTEHDSTPCETPLIDLEAETDQDIAAAEVEEPPTTPLGAATGVQQNAEALSPSDAGDPHNAVPSPDSEGPSRPTACISQKHRLNAPGSKVASKKRSIEKVPSLNGSFATSMDSFSQGKLKSLELKEKAMEQRFATQALRAETAQQQLQISQQQVGFEALRLKLEERKMEEDSATRAREFAATARARKVQARIDVIKSNAHRSPVELAEIIALVESVD